MDTWSAGCRRRNCAEHWRIYYQERAGTDPIPFNPSTRIVAHGLYRFTRNPMYVGFALWTLGLGILVDSAWSAPAVPNRPRPHRSHRHRAAKNDISNASSEMNISTTNAVSGAGSSSHRAQTVRATAVKYEGRTNHVPNSSAQIYCDHQPAQKHFHKQSSRQCSKRATVSSVSSPMLE